MRRFFSVVFFIIGGWILLGEAMVAGLHVDHGAGMSIVMTAVMAAFALPFLLLGTWISPGRRLVELGLTLMIVAGLSLFLGVFMAAILLDPGIKPFLPPDMPELRFNPALGIANLLLIGGGGYLLWRRRREA